MNTIQKRYSPSKEQLHREWMRHLRKKNSSQRKRQDIPDNSESWFSKPPETLGEILAVADGVAELDIKCKEMLKNS